MNVNVRGGRRISIVKDGYTFTFHFNGRNWQDQFYTDLAFAISRMGSEYIVSNGVEVQKISCNVSVSPETIVKQVVMPEFYFYGNQSNWELVCTSPTGEMII